jgi:hypothetical protein
MMARLHEKCPRLPNAIIGFACGWTDGTVSQLECFLQKRVTEQTGFIYLQKYEIIAQADVDNGATIGCVL